ncbi:MAG: hypothetical protein V2A61_07385 [Calditrichota bacterium]
MKRYILALSLMLTGIFPGCGFSESALSALGHGSQRDFSGARSVGMGYVSLTIQDTLGLNLTIPVLWNGPPLARFGLCQTLGRISALDGNGSDNSDEAVLQGAAFAVPIGSGKFLGICVSPYTRMNYKWNIPGTNAWGEQIERRQGRGGLTAVLAGLSFNLNPRLRLGLGARGIIGKIERLWSVEFPNSEAISASYTTKRRFQGIGGHLSWRFNSDNWIWGGAVNSPIGVWTADDAIVAAGGSVQETINRETADGIDTPWDLTIGCGRLYGHHLFAVEAAWHGWGQVNKTSSLTDQFKDSYRISLGWEHQPEYRPFDPFWRELTYRAGLFHTVNYAVGHQGYQARRLGLTGGISIPYNKNATRLDLALELSGAGERNRDGVLEKYIGLNLDIWHSEAWFLERRTKN